MEDTIMKKTYINPELNVVKIATQQMLAASDPDGYDGSINNSGQDGSNALSREFFDFDDEE